MPYRRGIAVLLALVSAGYVFSVWRQAQRALEAGADASSHAGEVPVVTSPIRSSSSPFQTVELSKGFASEIGFNGDVYRVAPASLSNANQVWHVGRELPAAPLGSIAVRTGGEEPEFWIATRGAGVLIYDGHLFRQLMPREARLRQISAMLPLANGQVLLGTPTAGLYVTDGRVLRLFHSSFASAQVTALAGNEDQFWVGTRADGAWLWRGGAAMHFKKELPDAQVLSMATKNDSAWIGTALGVTEFVGDKLNRQLAPGVFAKTLAEHDGTLQVGTIDQGTRTILLSATHAHPARLQSTRPEAADQQATENVEAQHITALHHDGRGNLWVGYFDRGMDIVSDRGVDHREDDRLFCINRIREHDGTIAVATANGLAMFDETTKLRQVLDRSTGLIADHVTDVLFDKDATVVATPAGLSFLDHGVTSIYGFHGLVNNHVYTLAEMDGTLYAGTLGGVSTIDRGLVKASFTTANSELRQNWITAAQMFGGKLYLGTYGSGVVEFAKGGTVTTFPSFGKTRTEINPNAMLATTQALYAGTAGQGLAILRAGDIRWRLITDGLPSLNVTALEAYNGTLYVGTDNGLVQAVEKSVLP